VIEHVRDKQDTTTSDRMLTTGQAFTDKQARPDVESVDAAHA
jgi:hypothetical protein